ncbi:MAG: tetratricopeptide repeat protein [Gammaproteobacteria bacterium]|nr:tetratricopeptide repeat protein [Gammaproteobacteria bacterium]
MKLRRGRCTRITLGLMLLSGAFIAKSSEIPRIDTGEMETRVRVLIEQTRKELENDIDTAIAWAQMARVLHAHDLTDAALICYAEANRREDDDYRWLYLAAVAAADRSPARSAEYFGQAALLQPNDSVFFIEFADVLTRLGRYDQARTAYGEAMEIDGRSIFARIGLARLALIRGELKDARTILERARDLSPRHNNVHTLLARVYQRSGDRILASEAGRLARVHKKRLKPYSPVISAMANLAVSAQAYRRRGARQAELGNLADAEWAYRQVLIIRAGSPEDFLNLATVLWELGKHTEALGHFASGLKLNPDHIELLSHQGRAYADIGQFDRAAKLLARAIDENPGFADAHLNSGVLRLRQERFEEAVEHFEHALTLDPSLYPVYLDLSDGYAGSGKLEAAALTLQRLRAIEPDGEVGLRKLGLIQARLGHYDEAIEALAHAQAIVPTHVETTYLLARLFATAPKASSRDAPRALAMAMDLYRIRPHDAGLADLLAMAYAAVGEFDKAIRLSERAIDIAGNKPRLVAALNVRLDLYRNKRPIYLPDEGMQIVVNL